MSLGTTFNQSVAVNQKAQELLPRLLRLDDSVRVDLATTPALDASAAAVEAYQVFLGAWGVYLSSLLSVLKPATTVPPAPETQEQAAVEPPDQGPATAEA